MIKSLIKGCNCDSLLDFLKDQRSSFKEHITHIKKYIILKSDSGQFPRVFKAT